MSGYGLDIWVGDEPDSDLAASRLAADLHDAFDARPSPPAPALLAFVEQVRAELGDLTDADDVTGQIAHLDVPFEVMERVYPDLVRIADEHGLICFDPQSGLVMRHPLEPPPSASSSPSDSRTAVDHRDDDPHQDRPRPRIRGHWPTTAELRDRILSYGDGAEDCITQLSGFDEEPASATLAIPQDGPVDIGSIVGIFDRSDQGVIAAAIGPILLMASAGHDVAAWTVRLSGGWVSVSANAGRLIFTLEPGAGAPHPPGP